MSISESSLKKGTGTRTPGSNHVGSDPVRCEIRRHLLHQMRRCGLALAVREARFCPPVEATDAACGNHLAFLLQVALVVARVEEFQEGDDAEEDGGGVDGESLCVFVERLVPEC